MKVQALISMTIFRVSSSGRKRSSSSMGDPPASPVKRSEAVALAEAAASDAAGESAAVKPAYGTR